jgi:hypothetical protein
MVVDDPDKPYKEPDTTTTIVSRNQRDYTKPMRLNRNPVYFDLLGNRLKNKPRNGVYVQK